MWVVREGMARAGWRVQDVACWMSRVAHRAWRGGRCSPDPAPAVARVVDELSPGAERQPQHQHYEIQAKPDEVRREQHDELEEHEQDAAPRHLRLWLLLVRRLDVRRTRGQPF